MAVMKEPFGSTQDGRAVDQYTLRCGHLEAEVLTYGAALRLLQVPDRNGEHVDVVLGYDSVSGYEDNGGYLGAVIGRYANRIAGARCVIDGRVVPLAANEGPKQLHGGPAGFDKQCFEARQTGESAVTFTYASLDGEGGFPGGLSAQVTYTLSEQGLSLHYEASADQTTYCNLTNHSYFNLNGGGDAMHHRLWLSSSRYTPVGPDSIPTAMARPVAGSPFDFTAEKAIGRDINADDQQLRNVGGYDHNFILDPLQGLRRAARLTGDRSGVIMEVWTDKPGLQLYTANGLTITGRGKRGAVYRPRQAVCLETQFFPDSPNHPEWGDILLRPGRRYDYTTEFRFTHI
ncbi:MAG: galactose mutarotase [Oscillospiraceae bacterium]|nr:galactose mutarotase [Oscillospiraceae bacterium]